MNRRHVIFATLFTLIFASAVAAAAPARNDDPLAWAVSAADRELFDDQFTAPGVRPAFQVHHDWDWLDSTLMPAVAMLYDRLEELDRTTPRYLDYLVKWGEYDPGTTKGPIDHGDRVCAGLTYMWLYERSGLGSDHLTKTDDMIDFIFTIKDIPQYQTKYLKYWMRFWNDDIHMVPPFLARRGRLAGNLGIRNGKDARELSMIYLRAYADILRDPDTGLYWHDITSIGDYMWGRGNGWAAAGMTYVHKELSRDPAYEKDTDWIRDKLVKMAATLKANRNVVGTWNADVLNRETYTVPESSGSAFFVYMMTYLINEGFVPREEYLPVVLKAWNFLKRSLDSQGNLMRVQPVGRGPITDDFEMNSESYGVGAFILAAIEMSKLDPDELSKGDEVECIILDRETLEIKDGKAVLDIGELTADRADFPASPESNVMAVVSGKKLPATTIENGKILIDGIADGRDKIYLFYRP